MISRLVVADNSNYERGTVIIFDGNTECIVLKKYKRTWLRLLLKWMGFKTRINHLKVKRL